MAATPCNERTGAAPPRPGRRASAFWRRLVGAAYAAISLAATAAPPAPPYLLTLEWPVVEAGPHALAVVDDTGNAANPGVTRSETIRHGERYRQHLSLSLELARCEGARNLRVYADLPSGSAATLTLSQAYQTIALWPQAGTVLGHEGVVLDLSSYACPLPGEVIGELTLAVDRPAPGTSLWEDVGHAWIEFRALAPQAPVPLITLGTYSDALREGAISGLNINRELGRTPDIRKTVPVNATQLAQAIAVVERYRSAGPAAWTIQNNCTGFATDVWRAATGESLSTTLAYPDAGWEVLALGIPNAGSLYHAMLASTGSVRGGDSSPRRLGSAGQM